MRLGLVLVLVVCACEPAHEPLEMMHADPPGLAPPVVPMPPPPPPPPSRGLRADEPGRVPPRIATFITDHAGPTWRATLYEYGRGHARFHGQSVATRRELDAHQARELANALADPLTYDDGDIGCVTVGIGLRLQQGTATLDLDLDLVCQHIKSMESEPEIHAIMKTTANQALSRLIGETAACR